MGPVMVNHAPFLSGERLWRGVEGSEFAGIRLGNGQVTNDSKACDITLEALLWECLIRAATLGSNPCPPQLRLTTLPYCGQFWFYYLVSYTASREWQSNLLKPAGPISSL